MICAYHTQNVAVVNCNGCGKPLCPSCDHRIKGFPYCQDCIVSGVELLRQQNQLSYIPLVKKQSSPFVALLLSLICPGLGAAYNSQTVKALVHFAIFVGLFQMWVLTDGTALFRWGVIGMWLFAAVDSWRTAQLIRSGVSSNGAEDFIVQRFSGNPKLWGMILTVLGASFFLQMFFNLRPLMRGILPVLLIGLGIYLLRDYVFKKKNKEPKWTDFEHRPEQPTFAGTISEYDLENDFPTQKRARSWKNQ